jgi:hypothetical protein
MSTSCTLFVMAIAMKLPLMFASLMAALVVFAATATAQNSPAGDPAAKPSTRRVVNITSDSAPGWLPSTIQEQRALKKTNDYFSALDAEDYQHAYATMTEINRNSMPLAQYIRQNQKLHERSGPLMQRNILKVTWTKKLDGPFPGVYAAIDIASRFVKMDRHCGFVILYQKPSDDDFEVMRQEDNSIDNATAESIEQQQSRAALDRTWAELAANCPNFGSAISPTSVR